MTPRPSVHERVEVAILFLYQLGQPISLRRIVTVCRQLFPSHPLAESSVYRDAAAYALYLAHRPQRIRKKNRHGGDVHFFAETERDRAIALLRWRKRRLVTAVLALEKDVAVLRRELAFRSSDNATPAPSAASPDQELATHLELLELARRHRLRYWPHNDGNERPGAGGGQDGG